MVGDDGFFRRYFVFLFVAAFFYFGFDFYRVFVIVLGRERGHNMNRKKERTHQRNETAHKNPRQLDVQTSSMPRDAPMRTVSKDCGNDFLHSNRPLGSKPNGAASWTAHRKCAVRRRHRDVASANTPYAKNKRAFFGYFLCTGKESDSLAQRVKALAFLKSKTGFQLSPE